MKFTDLIIGTNNLCQEIVMPGNSTKTYTMTIQPSGYTGNTDKIWREYYLAKKRRPESKYKFSRQWHEVVLPFFSLDSKFNLSIFKDDPRLLWCTEQFGPQPDYPDAWCRWYVKGMTVRFRDQQDYMLYLLRWGRD